MELLKEQLQENILCFLDGMENQKLDEICQIIIETVDTVFMQENM